MKEKVEYIVASSVGKHPEATEKVVQFLESWSELTVGYMDERRYIPGLLKRIRELERKIDLLTADVAEVEGVINGH